MVDRMLRNVKYELLICMPFFHGFDDPLEPIMEAHDRGVEVRLLTNTDAKVFDHTKCLRDKGIVHQVLYRAHAKIIVADASVIWGTFNFTYSSMNLNHEAAEYVIEVDKVFPLREHFMRMWGESAQR